LSQCIAEKPALPWNCQNATDKLTAYDLPWAHCSFKGCSFAAETDDAVPAHILEAHAARLTAACVDGVSNEALLRFYRAAMTRRCQSGAPVANAFIDRRALQRYQHARDRESDEISSLLCFVCAGKYPYLRSGRNQQIAWAQPVHGKNATVYYRRPRSCWGWKHL